MLTNLTERRTVRDQEQKNTVEDGCRFTRDPYMVRVTLDR